MCAWCEWEESVRRRALPIRAEARPRAEPRPRAET